MTQEELQSITALANAHRASDFLLRVRIKALKAAFLKLCERISIDAIEGDPLEDWIRKTEIEIFEQDLLEFEDCDPETAAMLQSWLDSRRGE